MIKRHSTDVQRRISLVERIGVIYICIITICIWRTIAYEGFWEVKNWVTQTDRENYENLINNVKLFNIFDILSYDGAFERGYIALSWLFSSFELGINSLILMNEVLFAYAFLRLSFLISSEHTTSLGNRLFICMVSISFLLMTPFFHSYSNNIIRQSFATSFVILFLVNFIERKIIISFLFFLLAPLLHFASIISLCALLVTIVLYKIRFPVNGFIVIFVISSLMYILEVPTIFKHDLYNAIFAFYNKVENFASSGNYQTGFKIKFFLTSFVGILLSIFIVKTNGRVSYVLFGMFSIITGAYMMLSAFDYYDRVAITSWILIPVFAALVVARAIFWLLKRRVLSSESGVERWPIESN